MKKVLAFSGSNSHTSINQQLIEIVSELVAHPVTVINLMDYPLPMYSIEEQNNAMPENIIQLNQLISEYDALIISVPEHNGLMPAFFKNVIDWLSRIDGSGKPFFGNKVMPTLLLSTSPGERGGVTSLNTLLQLMPRWGIDIKASYSLGNFYQKLNNEKFDKETENALYQVIEKFERSIEK